jgi:hypothetical protein
MNMLLKLNLQEYRMQKAAAFFSILFALFLAGLPQLVFSQEEGEDEGGGEVPVESDWDGFSPELYSRGDQTFVINLGAVFPTVFIDPNGVVPRHNINVAGGTGSLGYNYWMDGHFFVGGELAGMFAGTLAGNMLFMIPLGVKAGYQFVIRRFEFPLSLTVGAAVHNYLTNNYIGFFLKGGAAGYFRFNPDWSFGINAQWWWAPQWVKDSSKNMHGNFVEATLSARYHF